MQSQKAHYVFNYSKADFSGLSDVLLQLDFSNYCQMTLNMSIRQSVLNAMQLFIPKVRVQSQQSPKWFNLEIRHLLKCVSTLRRTSPTPHNLNEKEVELQQKLGSTKAAFEGALV